MQLLMSSLAVERNPSQGAADPIGTNGVESGEIIGAQSPDNSANNENVS